MHITYGTETYGRVKVVAGTPIVTRFAMFQYLPIYPLSSFYKTGADSTKFSGIPLIASTQTTTTHGIPLARVETVSAIMAYLRALFFVISVPGIIIGVWCVFSIEERPDEFLNIFTGIAITALFFGVVGGALTYAFSFTPVRERHIRTLCAELLGIGIDPARLTEESSTLIEDIARQQHGSSTDDRTRVLLGLIIVRARIATHFEVNRMEVKTDELLAYLETAN